MLDVARLSNHYQNLNTADYTDSINHPDDFFDASVCIGVYSQEFKKILINELVRIVKPGGHIVLSCRPVHFDNGAKPEIDALQAEGKISLISLAEEPYIREPHSSNATQGAQ